MFRRPRDTEADPIARNLAGILRPMPVMVWGGQAMSYLGVPVVVPVYTIVVQDEDYQPAIQKLVNSGFPLLPRPRREPAREVLESLPDPQAVMDEIHAAYRRVDEATTTFDYPQNSSTADVPEDLIKNTQLTLLPNSFTHLPPVNDTQYSHDYIKYDNIWYPCERALASSFVQGVVDDQDANQYSHWKYALNSWISLMIGYLEVNNDIFDDWNWLDERAKDWFSEKFGRAREAKHGPWDRRISKRIGSNKEMPVDARRNPIIP